jgi:hypothetical protein
MSHQHLKIKKQLKKILIYTTVVVIIGCQKISDNFLTNQFFPKLEEIVSDKQQLKEFKRLPIDSAVLSYHKFDEIFQEPVAILFQDTLIESKFVKSIRTVRNLVQMIENN